MIQNEKLEELFDEWKEAHIKDKLYKFDTPEIKGKYVKIDSFIKDGFCLLFSSKYYLNKIYRFMMLSLNS